LNIYIAPPEDSEAFPTQVSAITMKHDKSSGVSEKEDARWAQGAVVEEFRSR